MQLDCSYRTYVAIASCCSLDCTSPSQLRASWAVSLRQQWEEAGRKFPESESIWEIPSQESELR